MDAGLSVVRASGPVRMERFLTQRLRIVLENRAVRFGVVGMLMTLASLFSLIPTPVDIDQSWLFVLPVAISAMAAGLKEGLVVSLGSAAMVTLLDISEQPELTSAMVASVFSARFALYGITAGILGAFAEAHYAVQTTLRTMARLDPLTQVSNVKTFYEEMLTLETTEDSFAVLLVDVDDLKKINDTHGHQAGSAAIRSVANVLRKATRGSDSVARYGGDEFVVILRKTDRAGCQIAINRIRQVLKNEVLPQAPGVELSVSIGVAMSGEDGSTSEELLTVADEHMYSDKRARKAGRVTEPT